MTRHLRPLDPRILKIQGDSVRMTWGIEEPQEQPLNRPVRRDPPPRPAALIPTDDVLRLRLAEELEYARRMLDVMGDELAGDPAVVARHGRGLQSIDIVGQMLGHIASVIRSSDAEGAVKRIGMCELKARLMRKDVL